MVSLLIDLRADVTAKDGGGNAPLHIAAAFGRVEVCDVLLRAGADVNATNGTGYDAFAAAAENRCSSIVELFRHDVDAERIMDYWLETN